MVTTADKYVVYEMLLYNGHFLDNPRADRIYLLDMEKPLFSVLNPEDQWVEDRRRLLWSRQEGITREGKLWMAIWRDEFNPSDKTREQQAARLILENAIIQIAHLGLCPWAHQGGDLREWAGLMPDIYFERLGKPGKEL